MKETRPQDRPDFRCGAWHRMEPGQVIVRDVKAGTLRLRQTTAVSRGTGPQQVSVSKYLPIFPAEHPDDYRDRLNTAVLFNSYGRTVLGSKGLVFKKNPVLSPDMPLAIRGQKEERDAETGEVTREKVEGHWENLDLAGTHGDVFCQEVFESTFSGHAFVLVDMPPGLGLDGEKATRAELARLIREAVAQ